VNLHEVVFVDTTHGWAVGDSGTVLQTQDGGKHWTMNEVGFRQNFTSVSFVDRATGWVVSDKLGVLHTTDAGKSWNLQLAIQGGSGIQFIDRQHGWLVGYRVDSDSALYARTIDGGVHWLFGSTEGEFNRAVHFADSLHGWILGGPSFCPSKIFHSQDGGLTWKKQYDVECFAGLATLLLNIDAVDSNRAWVAGWFSLELFPGPELLATTNGGKVWERVNLSGRNASRLFDVDFIDAERGWLAGANGRGNTTVFQTKDGGASWQVQSFDSRVTLNSLSFVDSLHGWAVGDSGAIWAYLPETETNVAIKSRGGAAGYFELLPGYPNPFNASTVIRFKIMHAAFVRLDVFDVLGRKVVTLVAHPMMQGSYEVRWDGKDESGKPVESGVYLCRMQSSRFAKTRKLVLIR